jgi:hypothetical protein
MPFAAIREVNNCFFVLVAARNIYEFYLVQILNKPIKKTKKYANSSSRNLMALGLNVHLSGGILLFYANSAS